MVFLSRTDFMKITIYHNCECSKSNVALELLKKSNAKLNIVNYLDSPPSINELDSLLELLGKEPSELVRSHEDRFEELGLDKNPPKSRSEWLKTLTMNPILIERPIATNGVRAVIGRPPEKVLELL